MDSKIIPLSRANAPLEKPVNHGQAGKIWVHMQIHPQGKEQYIELNMIISPTPIPRSSVVLQVKLEFLTQAVNCDCEFS